MDVVFWEGEEYVLQTYKTDVEFHNKRFADVSKVITIEQGLLKLLYSMFLYRFHLSHYADCCLGCRAYPSIHIACAGLGIKEPDFIIFCKVFRSRPFPPWTVSKIQDAVDFCVENEHLLRNLSSYQQYVFVKDQFF